MNGRGTVERRELRSRAAESRLVYGRFSLLLSTCICIYRLYAVAGRFGCVITRPLFLPPCFPCAISWEHRLRCASKADKEAGILKRAREKESSKAQLESDQMAYEDEARDPPRRFGGLLCFYRAPNFLTGVFSTLPCTADLECSD